MIICHTFDCQTVIMERSRYREVPTWHWPMVSRPEELAELLHEAG